MLKNQPSRSVLMAGNKIAFKWQCQHLGVTTDAYLSWIPHLNNVQEKPFKVLQKMSRLLATNWGLRMKIRKMLYSIVVERIILYAASIWYSDKVKLAGRLLSIQRARLLCVTISVIRQLRWISCMSWLAFFL